MNNLLDWDSHQQIDFTSILGFVDIGIMSVKSVADKGRVFDGVFDLITYALIGILIIILSGIIHYSGNLSLNKYGHSLLLTLGMVLGMSKGFRNSFFHGESLGSRLTLSSLFVTSFFVINMYKSVIISVLTTGRSEKFIQDLEALSKRPDLDIYLSRSGSTEQLIQSSIYYEQLKPRFRDVGRNGVDMEKVIEGIHKETHVYLGMLESIKFSYIMFFPEEFVCNHDYFKMKFSKSIYITVAMNEIL